MGQTRYTNPEIIRITQGPKHHLFGFHDLFISNHNGDKYLALEADIINRPPLLGESFGVGYVKDNDFVNIGKTTALNYPQGARQQWVGDTDYFTVNNRVGDKWGFDLYDAEAKRLVDRYNSTAHSLTGNGKYAFGLDYARLHRLGGYGYTGLEDKGKHDPFPTDSGITITNLETKKSDLLVSVRQVAECGVSNLSGQTHHYLTHLSLNPSSDRLAFLHRYFMPDGGLMTRLMTIGIDGQNLRCLGQGFLSHYDWKDDSHLYIYGRTGRSVDAVRNSNLLQNHAMAWTLKLAKKCVKAVLGKQKGLVGGMHFLMIEDSDTSKSTPFAESTICHDGHPMTNPIDRDWCIFDTYPDALGDRQLFFYQFSSDTRVNVGVFRRLFEEPDTTLQEQYLQGMEPGILKNISPKLIAFTRSGLHCDLHPRWSADGRWGVFDSIHEGTRQIYKVAFDDLVIKPTTDKNGNV